MRERLILALVLTLVLISIVTTTYSAYLLHARSVIVHALAVSGTEGEVLNIEVTMIYPGDGLVYIAALPLPAYGPGGQGQMFIASSQLAFYIASMLAWKSPFNYSFLIRVTGNVVEIGGPSASAYITAAMFALLTNNTLRNDVTMTGMILPGGLVGPVGDVPIKVRAAARAGFRIVLVPLLNYIMLPPENYGIKVIPVIDVAQAIRYLVGVELTNKSLTLEDIYNASRNITRTLKYIYETIREVYETLDMTKLKLRQAEQVYDLYQRAEKEASEENYYTAASLVYQAIVKYYEFLYKDTYNRLVLTEGVQGAISYFDNIAQELKNSINNIMNEISNVKPTIYTIDLLIGIYERIHEAEDLLNQYYTYRNSGTIGDALSALALAKARVLSLYTWLEVLKYVEKNYPSKEISEVALRRVTNIYIQYCKALIGYSQLIKIVGVSSNLEAIVSRLVQLYEDHKYVQALGTSFYYLSNIASSLMLGFLRYAVTQSEYRTTQMMSLLLDGAYNLKEMALTSTYNLVKRGLLPIYSIMYIQFGNYYMSNLNTTNMEAFIDNITMVYNNFILAQLHDDIIEFLYLSQHGNITQTFTPVSPPTAGPQAPTTPSTTSYSSSIIISIPIIVLSIVIFLAGILLVVVFVLLEKKST
ncbi:MAG: hypothetical protein GXO26_04060 [Crenarchaeota archaeon]|nr:hypothetical protein [Thermoproteota archaeon]